jgi:hypothetical protein
MAGVAADTVGVVVATVTDAADTDMAAVVMPAAHAVTLAERVVQPRQVTLGLAAAHTPAAASRVMQVAAVDTVVVDTGKPRSYLVDPEKPTKHL